MTFLNAYCFGKLGFFPSVVKGFHIAVLIFKLLSSTSSSVIDEINLPSEHIPYYFNNYPEVANRCLGEPDCPYDQFRNLKNKCWGYELGCQQDNSFSVPQCHGDHRGWVKSKAEQINTFYNQGDFGYIKEQLRELSVFCKPTFSEDSSLECTDHLRFCRGRNIFMNFTSLANRNDRIRYHMDVLSEGDIGGHCDLNKALLQRESDQISPLQSWGPELRYFQRMDKRVAHETCDITIHTPTFIMKIDATVNLYHHFCDFFNLYASQHINSSHPSSFSTDVRILIWETYPYRSNFGETWDAFTQYPVWNLNNFKGKSVCFRNIVFPLLPRMIFGLYYNTPVIWGCESSGLFRAFSMHVLHRLKIKTLPRKVKKLTVTLLSRESSYRNILNEAQLLEELNKDSQLIVNRVVYNRELTFKQQLQLTRDSDIFIGIHGAGLTHLLFLPDWAVVFELYNCEDEHCYQDLARLRGVKYITWERKETLFQEDEGHHPDGGAHAKFTNYRFDPAEFIRLVNVAASHVRQHKSYKKFTSTVEKSHDEL